MKKITLLSSTLALSLMFVFTTASFAEEKAADASATAEKSDVMEKMGFLTTDKCAAAGQFTDCYLENYSCGSDDCFKKVDAGVSSKVNIVLFSHIDGKTYNVDVTNINPVQLDKAINRNDDTVIGKYNEQTNTIVATEVKGPPPPKKSFFKGCL